MADLGKAYVQIIPKAEGITNKMNSLLGGAGKSAGAKAGKEAGGAAGSGLLSGIKKALTAAAIGAPIIAGVKAALSQGSELEQNLGGTKAVFGNFANTIQSKAQAAYKNMGMSASDYMATANKMGSLFQGSGLDQRKALYLTSDAMQRAADVASVMGLDTASAMESIAGAAKGNFAMMDNLGVAMNATTLQAYALEKGMNFKWETASNAEKAELAMQMFMDRTSQYAGNFARESQETFSGSFGAMQAAASNFLANLTLHRGIEGPLRQLISTTSNFLFGNLLPMIGDIFSSLPFALGSVLPGALQTVATEYGPQAAQALGGLLRSIIDYAPTALAGLGEKITGVFEFIDKNSLIDKGIQMIGGFADGILDGVPGVLSNVGSMISTAITFIVENLPEFVQKGAEIIGGIVQGIGEHLPEIGQAALDLIVQIVTSIGENLPQLVESGMTMLGQIQAGILNALPQLPGTIAEGVSSAAQAVVDTFSQTDWGAIGQNLLSGIANGISSYVNLIAPAVKGIVSAIDNALQFTATINKVKAAFGKIKQSIKEALDKAKETVKSAIEKIKGIFPLSIGKIFSNLQLPHISVSAGSPPYGIGGLGEKPTFGITWNKKAMLEPYMFGNATLFGAGEAGDEILYGRGALMRDISTAIADGGGGNTFNVTLNASTDESPEEYADRFYREMKRVVRMGM